MRPQRLVNNGQKQLSCFVHWQKVVAIFLLIIKGTQMSVLGENIFMMFTDVTSLARLCIVWAKD